uniref:Uncharacterized protein n=1 Tax=viral metagenome TaxID=1070528 RepID=A0A6C0KXP6_9ZZZZ|tara:strand:+ start:35203 stop:35610 length:408 start_codon:yes stop_codon:yes gene_type:complete
MSNDFQKKQIVKAFVDIYFDLLSTIKEQLENKNAEFNKFYAKNFVLKKTNIKLFIKTWYEYITKQYYHYIMDNNVNYFFSDELQGKLSQEFDVSVMKYILLVKEKYNSVSNSIVESILAKIKLLTQISYQYFNTK